MAKDTTTNTPPGILAFAHIFTPRARSKGKEADYNANLIFEAKGQQHPYFKALVSACEAAVEAKFGDSKVYQRDPKAFIEKIKAADLWPIKDGSDKEYQGFGPGTVFINPWSKDKPEVLRPVPGTKEFIEVTDPAEVFAGQIVKFNVNAFAWENSGKIGVSFGLNSVLLLKEDMPRLDGRVSGKKAFADDEDAEDFADDPFAQ